MAGWRYFATRLNGNGTETTLERDIPLEGVSFSSVLSGPDALGGTIPVEVASLKATDGQPLIIPWATALYAELDGTIRSGCIVTDTKARDNTLAIDATGFSGYPQGMPYQGADLLYAGRDPLDIVRESWAWLQAQRNGNLGMVVDSTKSTRKTGTKTPDTTNATDPALAVKMNWQNVQDIGKFLDDLSVWTPFDYRESHSWVGNTIQHRLLLGAPRLGARKTTLRFVVGENVAVVPDSIDEGSDYASEVFILGAGEGTKMIRSVKPRGGETRIRRVKVISDKSLATKIAADQRAALELSLRNGIPEVSEVKLIEHPNAPLGSVVPGDEILLQFGKSGWQGNTAYWVRVLEVTVRPDDPTTVSLSVMRVEGI